jgi:hypothetical protein
VFLFLQMIQVLSIDLDSMWNGTDSVSRDPEKKLNSIMVDLIKSLSQITWNEIRVGIDHHSICVDLDRYRKNYKIDHIDAHHDLFADGHSAWLNPLFIRSRRVNIGNFLFQLLRERNLISLKWLIPNTFDVAQCKLSVEQNIGKYYAGKVKVKISIEHEFRKHYDFVFISLSPEWIPKRDLEIVEEVLSLFQIPRDSINNYLQSMHKRWACNDDNLQILEDRFYFKNMYKIIQ